MSDPPESPEAGPKTPDLSMQSALTDEAELARLGYGQELLREMGGFSNFAMSFSIISILTGILTTFSDALGPGGPRGIGLGWLLVSAGTLVVALAMAELASAFPTAGALYHWSALLGGPAFGWFTAAFNLLGQFTIVAAIDYGLSRELGALLGIRPLALFAAVLATHAAINAVSTRAVAKLNDLSALVHVLGVAILVVALVAFAPKHPLGFLAEARTTRPDGNTSLGFANALIMGMFTFTGYDASAHMSEETHDPARRAPVGILSSVIVSAVAGYALAASLTLAVPDLASASADDHAALHVLRHALGPRAGSAGMALALVAMWFCGLSRITSASRTLYAFARDGGPPFARGLRQVHATARTPVPAILVVALAAFAFVAIASLLRDRVFALTVQVATMGLYVSYGTPIALGALARHRGLWRRSGPFSLGRMGLPVAWLASAWALGVLVVCSLPPNAAAGAVLAGALASLGLFWHLFVRKRFKGPPLLLADLEAKPPTPSM